MELARTYAHCGPLNDFIVTITSTRTVMGTLGHAQMKYENILDGVRDRVITLDAKLKKKKTEAAATRAIRNANRVAGDRAPGRGRDRGRGRGRDQQETYIPPSTWRGMTQTQRDLVLATRAATRVPAAPVVPAVSCLLYTSPSPRD